MNELAAENLDIRQGTLADFEAVRSFTTDTWGEGSDYIPHVYGSWMDSEGPAQRTFVAVDREADLPDDAGAAAGEADVDANVNPDGRAVGVCQAVRLSEHEGWVQAMRVDPEYQGKGLSTALNDAAFSWLYEQGVVVARNMVFSWNVGGLGGSRAAGFGPGTEFRWAHPTPDSSAPTGDDAGPDAAWAFWQACDARSHLDGLALDGEESWALSELTRADLRDADEDGRLQTVSDDGVAGFSYRNRTYDRENDEGVEETWAEYAVAAWRDPETCARLLDAVANDAASVDADRTRVLIPESVTWVSDVAAARTKVSEEPDFVMSADLTRQPWNRD